MAKTALLFLALCMCTGLIISGCVRNPAGSAQEQSTASVKGTYRGKVVKKSSRQKTIILETIHRGNAEAVTLTYDRKTRGIDHAVPGKQVIISVRKIKNALYARSIRPDLDGLAPGVTDISPKKVRKLISNGDEMILIDTRSKQSYQQAHLPTAVSIPSCETEKTDLLPEEKDTLLIFYCGGELCGMSTLASSAAVRRGYTNVRVMRKGISGWEEAGFAVLADDNWVLKGGAVLIDLRPASRNTVNRIPGSVSVPFDNLSERLKPVPRKAPVIVYSDNIQQTVTALSMLRSAGFKHPSMVSGNFQGWISRNRLVTSGPIVTKITWKRQPAANEVSSKDFTHAVTGNTGVQIIDVRTPAETSAGRIRGALPLPLNELYDRMDELPKNKKIYLYSATGSRAEMAARLLRNNGFKAWFLAADINCSGGKCTIVH